MKKNFVGKAFETRAHKISGEECKALCEAQGFVYRNGLEERVFLHVITDGTVDRDGDIILPKGVSFEAFMKNPTILWAHDNFSLPVGRSLKIWYDQDENNIKSLSLIYDNEIDVSGESEKIYRFLKHGAVIACSVGVMPKQDGVYRPSTDEERKSLGLGKYGAIIKACELYEYSICNIGSNYNALLKMVKSEGDGDGTNNGNTEGMAAISGIIEDVVTKCLADNLGLLVGKIDEVLKVVNSLVVTKDVDNMVNEDVEEINDSIKSLFRKGL